MSTCAWDITTQDDVDRLQSEIDDGFDSCGFDSHIQISGATGTLDFTTLSSTGSITVSDSPGLVTLSFPQLTSIKSVEISDATTLTTLSIPELNEGSLTFYIDGQSGILPIFSFNITNAPNLQTVNLAKSIYLGDLNLVGKYIDFDPFKATTIQSISTDSCIDLSGAKYIGNINLHPPPEYVPGYLCSIDLRNLESVGSLTMDNSPAAYASFSTSRSSSTVQFNGSVILTNANDWGYIESYEFDRIETIHKDLNVTSFSNVHVNFGGLTQAEGTISLVNNTNCSFSFDQASSLTDLIMVDNVDTVLPLFPKLQTVNNIHIRGNIDTSNGPNIFPALTLARGNVTIEAWNDDFDCSKLISQFNDALIHRLSCNVGDGQPSVLASLDNSPATSGATRFSALPRSAFVGTGVGPGLFGIGLLATFVWLISRYKHCLGQLGTAQRQKQTTKKGSIPTQAIAPRLSD